MGILPHSRDSSSATRRLLCEVHEDFRLNLTLAAHGYWVRMLCCNHNNVIVMYYTHISCQMISPCARLSDSRHTLLASRHAVCGSWAMVVACGAAGV